MKPFPWLKLFKKSRPEAPLEPPIWLGNQSNGEFFREQTARDRLIRRLILERADVGARKHAIERRQFLASSMGMATSLAVLNHVAACESRGAAGAGAGGARSGSGTSDDAGTMGARDDAGGLHRGAIDAGGTGSARAGAIDGGAGSRYRGDSPGDAGGEGGVGGTYTTGDPMDPECTAERMLDPSREFVFDLQTHHAEAIRSEDYENWFYIACTEQALCGKELAECFSRDAYIDLMFMQSHTSLAMLSAVPAVEGELPLTNDEMAASRDYINQLAHSQRVLIQGQVLPNNGLQRQLDGMQRLVEELKVVCWKVHTQWGPNNTLLDAPDGFWLDDPSVGIPFIERARETGVKVFCCHKGPASPLFNAEHASPRDFGPIAKAFPDTHWIAYHAGYLNGTDVLGPSEGPYEYGSMIGINSLITTMKASGIGPNENIYAELGSVWNYVMLDPTEAAHVIGKLLLYVGDDNVLWGSDAIWTAKPQPYVDAFWNFEITAEFQQQYGYPALTKELKRKVLGLNAARLFDVDVQARRCEIASGALASVKRTLDGEFGPRAWLGGRPLGPTTRREFMRLHKLREYLRTPG